VNVILETRAAGLHAEVRATRSQQERSYLVRFRERHRCLARHDVSDTGEFGLDALCALIQRSSPARLLEHHQRFRHFFRIDENHGAAIEEAPLARRSNLR
jgi:hypothetical protein